MEKNYNIKPDGMIGVLKIESVDYALAKWSNPGRQAYVPYEYMKRKYPDLVMNYLTKRVTFRNIKD